MTSESKLISEQHYLKLDKYISTFRNSTPNFLIIDDFFSTDTLNKIQCIVERNEKFAPQCFLFGEKEKKRVTPEEYQQSPESLKFYRRSIWRNFHTDLQSCDFQELQMQLILNALLKPPFTNILSNFCENTTWDAAKSTAFLYKFEAHDMIKPHNDVLANRQICVNYYLSKNWQSEFGGKLYFKGASSSEKIEIEPIYNRAVIFSPQSQGATHWVEEVKGNQPRFSIVSWHHASTD